MKWIKYFLTVRVLTSTFSLSAQLVTIHWLPPMHARIEWGPQYLYLSTPETTPFPVEITDGGGNALGGMLISNSQPARYYIGNDNDSPVMVPEQGIHLPLQGKGLMIKGEKPFYAGFRTHSNSEYQAGDLTCKGNAAAGTIFRIGHLYQSTTTSDTRSNFIGIMALQDSTVVTLNGYDPNVRFLINGTDTPQPNGFSFTLNAGISFVIAQYINSNPYAQPPNGLIGALLSSNKPIVVNTGAWTGAPIVPNAADIGIDQITPLEQVGKEYILCKGNGGTQLETPIVVAHYDNTKVWINGASAPYTTLNAGQHLRIPSAQYSTGNNMYVSTSEPVWMYQMIGGVPNGNDEYRTGGLIFVPPISCAIPNAVDNLYQPGSIGQVNYNGGFMIVAMRDSVVEVRIDGQTANLGTPETVPGNPDFVTYRRLSLFTETNPPQIVSVKAQGAVQVALFGRNGAAGYGGFFSGFSKTDRATVQVQQVGDGLCPDTLIATGHFDGVQWFYEDSLLQFGADTFLVAYAPGHYTVQGYLGVCRKNDVAEDEIDITFNAPELLYSAEIPSCFGFSNGSISFETPEQGFPPFQYSINNGQTFYPDTIFTGLASGHYQLVVKDIIGCYNRPGQFFLDQPDSMSVRAYIVTGQPPFPRDKPVTLAAHPQRAISSARWAENGVACCNQDTLTTVIPHETSWYSITVLDEEGCPATDSLLLVLEPAVYAPNVFKPTEEAPNHRFALYSKASLPVNYFQIFDRWGDLVFEQRNFNTNSPEKGWDGDNGLKRCLPGVYVYVAEIEYLEGFKLLLKGSVTLLR